jgi:hypothetical protein
MKKMNVIILFIFCFFTAIAQKPAVVTKDKNGWQKIGETEASFKKQDESIHVFGKDKFGSIKLKVDEGPLNIDRLQVFYESGEMEDFDVKSKILPGEETRSFRLTNPDKEISKVAFTYQTAPNERGEKAKVMLLGIMAGQQSTEAYRNEAEETRQDMDETVDDTERDLDKAAENTEEDLDSAMNRTGNEISQGVSKGAAEIKDQRHKTKVGPNNQVIYIDDNGKYYYVDRQGQKVYVPEHQLKDKKDQ